MTAKKSKGRKPFIVINAKTYLEGTGLKAIALVKACDAVAAKYGVEIALAPQAIDLASTIDAAERTRIYAQHVDPGEPGRHTGFQLASNIVSLGTHGTILNHSEHKLERGVLEDTIMQLRSHGDFTIILCADTPKEAKKLISLKPDFIAVEPPELIGGDTSVSTAKPELITDALEAVGGPAKEGGGAGGIPLLVGAGIKTGADVRKALDLGAVGVLVASGVVKSPEPQNVLEAFADC